MFLKFGRTFTSDGIVARSADTSSVVMMVSIFAGDCHVYVNQKKRSGRASGGHSSGCRPMVERDT
jgi:hypothetical protein